MCLTSSVFALPGPVMRTAPASATIDDRLQKLVILRGVPAADRVGLVMDVFRRMIRAHDEPLHVGRTEMENAGFAVIDPNDGVVMTAGHGTGSLRRSTGHEDQ